MSIFALNYRVGSLPREFRGWLLKCSAVIALALLFATPASANTPWQDLDLNVEIEIGDLENDFRDENKTFEKGRYVTYRVHLKNNGSKTHQDLVILMDSPDYMNYAPDTTHRSVNSPEALTLLPDDSGVSPLEKGFFIEHLSSGEEMFFTIQFQAEKEIADTQVYTAASAAVTSKYGAIPIFSNTVENLISGESRATIQVIAEAMPEAGSKVNAGFQIVYNYTIRNIGGEDAIGINFTTYLPENTGCISGCGVHNLGALQSNEFTLITMIVEVRADFGAATQISNIGFDLTGYQLEPIQNRTPIIHYIDSQVTRELGEFSVAIVQEPNIVLNSSNGLPRPDLADRTETKYTFTYKGRKQPFTYPTLSSTSGYVYRSGLPCSFSYPHQWGTYSYAYNSSGGGGSSLVLQSSPIIFNVETTLPESAPKLLFVLDVSTYSYGETTFIVNSFMKSGGVIAVPEVLTISRAVENGAMGIIGTTVNTTVSEDRWQYTQYSTRTCSYSCGDDDTCEVEIPLYQWEMASSIPVELEADATTDISVYTSTAWLKTEKGHLGSNDRFTNDVYTDANYVDLGVPEFSNHLTPSNLYTPPGETNADFMIFSKTGTGSFETAAGEDWKVVGTGLPFLQRGNVYDREINPRDYYDDLLVKQKFGKVIENELASNLYGTVHLGDNTIWKNTGDITIGQLGLDDEVIFGGGRARIYTDGDVYINANIRYSASTGNSYGSITSIRIDARNIFIAGEVTDLEVMLLARETFKSGKSKNQLRILGDVIAGQAYWEREPLLETQPGEFNKPSEYIIEDMRKYVLPPPGDSELPDDYNVWRQVNPSTGEVLDAY